MPVKSFPAMWETATVIMLGKHKQGEVHFGVLASSAQGLSSFTSISSSYGSGPFVIKRLLGKDWDWKALLVEENMLV